MIDPTKITDYDRSDSQLEELLLFCIAVAGKNATTTSKNLERFLLHCGEIFGRKKTPFELIQCIEAYSLASALKHFGFGCYNLKASGFWTASQAGLDLRKCTAADLERIPGIGMKTSRFFILHSRRNADVACLDTHVLKWLGYFTGYEVPGHTPAKKKYLELEKAFLGIAKAMKIDPADLDLKIWNKMRGSDAESLGQAA